MDSPTVGLQFVFKAIPFLHVKFIRCQEPTWLTIIGSGIASGALLPNRLQTNINHIIFALHQKCPRRDRRIQSWRVTCLFNIETTDLLSSWPRMQMKKDINKFCICTMTKSVKWGHPTFSLYLRIQRQARSK